MNDDLLSVIAEKMPSFSKGQRSIAEYILQSYDKAAFLTANALGKTVKVSESTVVRFSYLLGFDGYPQLQQALQKTVLKRFHAPQVLKSEKTEIGESDLLASVLREDSALLHENAAKIDRAAFEGAVSSLIQAKRVYLLGTYTGALVAAYLQTYLQLLLENVRFIATPSKREITEQAVWLSPQDTMLAVCFSKDDGTADYGLSLCRKTGAKSIVLTDCEMETSPDYLLRVKSGTACLAPSPAVMMSIALALLVAVEKRKQAETAQTLRQLQVLQDGE